MSATTSAGSERAAARARGPRRPGDLRRGVHRGEGLAGDGGGLCDGGLSGLVVDLALHVHPEEDVGVDYAGELGGAPRAQHRRGELLPRPRLACQARLCGPSHRPRVTDGIRVSSAPRLQRAALGVDLDRAPEVALAERRTTATSRSDESTARPYDVGCRAARSGRQAQRRAGQHHHHRRLRRLHREQPQRAAIISPRRVVRERLRLKHREPDRLLSPFDPPGAFRPGAARRTGWGVPCPSGPRKAGEARGRHALAVAPARQLRVAARGFVRRSLVGVRDGRGDADADERRGQAVRVEHRADRHALALRLQAIAVSAGPRRTHLAAAETERGRR